MVSGKLTVNDEVFVDIALASLQQVENVIRQNKKGALAGLGNLFSGKMASKVLVHKQDDEEDNAQPGQVTFDLRLVMVFGVNIPEVAEKVRAAVAKEVNAITGYSVERIDITVERLVRPEELEEDK